MSSSAFMPRPDIHGAMLGLLFGAFDAAPMQDEVADTPAPEPTYECDFEPAESCFCAATPWPPCSYCEPAEA